jgi:hypothetical protein
MPQEKLRVIIGQGTSTEIFRQTADPYYATVIFGDRGLWASVDRHKMGQPAHALTLPGQPVPRYQTAQGGGSVNSNAFMDSTTYQQKLLALSEQSDIRDNALHLDGWRATRVVRNNSGRFPIKVKYTGRQIKGFQAVDGEIDADQVVFATGIAPQKGHDIPGLSPADLELFKKNRGFNPVQESLEFIACRDKPKDLDSVIVYGGGATSAWLCEMVLERKPKHFWWVAREKGSGFTKAMLPGKRNQKVLDNVVHKELNVTSLKYLQPFETARGMGGKPLFAARKEAKLWMTFEDPTMPKTIGHALVDLFVYSVAGDPDAAGSIKKIVDDRLFKELAIIRDANCVLSSKGGGALAWGTEKRDVLVAGAAAFTGMQLPKGESAPMATLPWGSQVPDGIAVAVSTISALNSYVPIKQVYTQQETPNEKGARPLTTLVSESNINMNLADRDQIACHLAVFYDLAPRLADLCVDEIIQQRAKKGAEVKNTPDSINTHLEDAMHEKAFGLSEEEVEAIIYKYVKMDPTSQAAAK